MKLYKFNANSKSLKVNKNNCTYRLTSFIGGAKYHISSYLTTQTNGKFEGYIYEAKFSNCKKAKKHFKELINK